MTKSEAKALKHGLYRVFWKNDGGSSLAAVGSYADGERWLAPTNWVFHPDIFMATTAWLTVQRVELIAEG